MSNKKPNPVILITGVSEFLEDHRSWMYKDIQKDLIQASGIPADYTGAMHPVDRVTVMNLEIFNKSKNKGND